MHTCFGIGAVLGPAMVGVIGYRTSFIIIAIVSMLPMAGLLSGYICGLQSKYAVLSPDEQEKEEERDKLDEETAENTTHNTVEEGAAGNRVRGRSEHSVNVLTRRMTHTSAHSVKSSSSMRSKHSNISNGPFSLHIDTKPPIDSSKDTAVRKEYALPGSIKYLTTLFYFVYMGYETGFSGWIPTYALDMGVTSSQSNAAYLGSIYWGAITLGRVIAIFVAIHLTATQMVRVKLVLCIAFTIVMVLIASTSYTNCAVSAALFGFAVSSIFPLAMTVLTDYGFAV
jgi:hypothetical protein